MSENVISVSQFNNYVHSIFLAEELLLNICIYGEISEIKVSGGNAYFSIKDESAMLPCVKFGVGMAPLPKVGDLVLVRGSPNYYVKGGRFSFNVYKIEPYGQGLLYQQFLELKNKLERLGYFNPAIKKPLPDVIKRVGVVTSPTGAVIQDIIDIAGRRNPLLDIVLYPAKVQGVGAEETICAGIAALDQTNVDVIVVARGGGSIEDLSAFNTERVANAIFNAQKPVISAVGHETDYTIADLVADLRAPTPSAAAEIVAVDIEGLKQDVYDFAERLSRVCEEYVVSNIGFTYDLYKRLRNSLDITLKLKENRLRENMLGFLHAVNTGVNAANSKFELLAQRLEGLNPVKILRLGYAQVGKGGESVNSVKSLRVGDELELILIDGKVECSINKIKKEDV